MSRPFSRIVDEEESGSGSQAGGAGAGVRGWWRNSRGTERRRESMSSNESVPKSPSQGNEMVSVSSNFAGLSPIIAPDFYHQSTSNSPVSPRARSNSMLSVPQSQPPLQDPPQPLEIPQPAAMRNETIGTRSPAMVEVAQASQTQRPVDVEAQRRAVPVGAGTWWRKGSLKGLQSKLFVCLISGMFLAITLAICQYTFYCWWYLYW